MVGGESNLRFDTSRARSAGQQSSVRHNRWLQFDGEFSPPKNWALHARAQELTPSSSSIPLAMAILPTSLQDANWYPVKADRAALWLRFVARRFLVFGILIAIVLFTLLRMLSSREVVVELAGQGRQSSRWPGMRLPPLYSQYHQNELALPQHRWHAVSHEDEPKYLFVSGHTWGMIQLVLYILSTTLLILIFVCYTGLGWGNVMQEVLLNAYLSYKSNRAYVSPCYPRVVLWSLGFLFP